MIEQFLNEEYFSTVVEEKVNDLKNHRCICREFYFKEKWLFEEMYNEIMNINSFIEVVYIFERVIEQKQIRSE